MLFQFVLKLHDFTKYTVFFSKDPVTKSSKYEFKWLISTNFSNKIQKKFFAGTNFLRWTLKRKFFRYWFFAKPIGKINATKQGRVLKEGIAIKPILLKQGA